MKPTLIGFAPQNNMYKAHPIQETFIIIINSVTVYSL